MVGALAAAGAGHRRYAPHPPFHRLRADELQLRLRPFHVGSALWDLYPAHPRAARALGFWRTRAAAARLPEGLRDVPEPLADFSRRSGGLKRPARKGGVSLRRLAMVARAALGGNLPRGAASVGGHGTEFDRLHEVAASRDRCGAVRLRRKALLTFVVILGSLFFTGAWEFC